MWFYSNGTHLKVDSAFRMKYLTFVAVSVEYKQIRIKIGKVLFWFAVFIHEFIQYAQLICLLIYKLLSYCVWGRRIFLYRRQRGLNGGDQQYGMQWSIAITCLTHWGWVTHMCVSKITIIGSDNGLSPGRRQAIIWINAGILLIGPLGTKFSEIYVEILTFSFEKTRLKESSAKWR